MPGGHAPSTAQHSVALRQDKLCCVCGSQMPSGHTTTFCQVSNQLNAQPDTHRFNQFILQCPVPSARPINQLVNQVPHEQINWSTSHNSHERTHIMMSLHYDNMTSSRHDRQDVNLHRIMVQDLVTWCCRQHASAHACKQYNGRSPLAAIASIFCL